MAIDIGTISIVFAFMGKIGFEVALKPFTICVKLTQKTNNTTTTKLLPYNHPTKTTNPKVTNILAAYTTPSLRLAIRTTKMLILESYTFLVPLFFG